MQLKFSQEYSTVQHNLKLTWKVVKQVRFCEQKACPELDPT